MTDASTVSELAVRPDPLDRLREDRVRAHTLGQSWQAHRLERGQCRLLVCVAALVAPAPGRPRRSGPSHSRRRLCSCPDAGRPPDGLRFPTGMRLVSAISTTPTPWFWGINGAALSSPLALPLQPALPSASMRRSGSEPPATSWSLLPPCCWRPFGRDLAPPLRSLHPSEDANKLWKCQFCWRRRLSLAATNILTVRTCIETTRSVIAFWSQSV
jgi:hypothetical protein